MNLAQLLADADFVHFSMLLACRFPAESALKSRMWNRKGGNALMKTGQKNGAGQLFDN